MAENADVRRVGIELGSEGVSTSSSALAWDPSICPSNQKPPGQIFKARTSLFPLPWMLTPAHLPAHMHSLAGIFRGLYRAFYFNVTYRKHERDKALAYSGRARAGIRSFCMWADCGRALRTRAPCAL